MSKLIKKYFKNSKGFTTIYAVIFSAIFLLIILFLVVHLNEDLSIKKENLISNTPTIEVVVVNNVNTTPSYTTENGTFYFNNPSVLIYAEFPVRGKFLNFSEKTIKYTSIAQVQFRR